MNTSLMTLEIWVIALGIVLMLADFFFGITPERKKVLAYLAIAALGVMLLTILGSDAPTGTAFNGAFVEDPLAIFFKRFFLVAAILVLFLACRIFGQNCRRHHGILFSHHFCPRRDAFCRVVQ